VIRTALFTVTTFASTLFFSLTAMLGGLVRAPRGLFDWVHRNWSRSLLRVAGVRVDAAGHEGLDPDGSYVFVSNHQSFFDIWAMMATLPASLRFVAKKELSRIPLFATAMRAAGHVFIDRKNPNSASAAIRRAGKRMRSEGLSLVFFPEGTRSPDGSLQRFKKGSFSLAIETQVELVPVAVDGGAEILPRGAKRPSPGTLRLRCAEPISLAGLDARDRDRLLEQTRSTISRMLGELQRGGEERLAPADP
jgi:1-acyl-sn-glycerol-3-phosphate acyltransferase